MINLNSIEQITEIEQCLQRMVEGGFLTITKIDSNNAIRKLIVDKEYDKQLSKDMFNYRQFFGNDYINKVSCEHDFVIGIIFGFIQSYTDNSLKIIETDTYSINRNIIEDFKLTIEDDVILDKNVELITGKLYSLVNGIYNKILIYTKKSDSYFEIHYNTDLLFFELLERTKSQQIMHKVTNIPVSDMKNLIAMMQVINECTLLENK